MVARSSTEADYQAAAKGGRKAQWLCLLLWEISLLSSSPTPLTMHCNNQGVIVLANSPVLQQATEHVTTSVAWLQEHVVGRDTLFFIFLAPKTRPTYSQSHCRQINSLHSAKFWVWFPQIWLELRSRGGGVVEHCSGE